MENKHIGPVEFSEPIGPLCPICDTPLLRLIGRDAEGEPHTHFACDCMALEDVEGELIALLDKEWHGELRDFWGREVIETMTLYPEKFPPGSMPGPIDL